MANGEPISFTATLIRNLIRIGDMLPGIYGVGILSVFLSQRFMRIGDLAANTVVVKVKNNKNAFSDFNNTYNEHQNIGITPKEESLLTEYGNRIKILRILFIRGHLRINYIFIFTTKLVLYPICLIDSQKECILIDYLSIYQKADNTLTIL